MPFNGASYTPDFVVANYYPEGSPSGQYCRGLNITLPDVARFPKPAEGYKYVVCNIMAGYIHSDDIGASGTVAIFFQDYRFQLLERNIAVVGVGLNGCRSETGVQTPPVPQTNGVPGRGIVHPPGLPKDPNAPGQDGWQDPAKINPFKEFCWALQHLLEFAELYQLTRRIEHRGVAGSRSATTSSTNFGSASAAIALFPALHPDLADPTALDSRRQSTRVGAWYGANGQWDLTKYKLDTTFTFANVINFLPGRKPAGAPNPYDYENQLMNSFREGFDIGYTREMSAWYYGFRNAEARKANAKGVSFFFEAMSQFINSGPETEYGLGSAVNSGFIGTDSADSCKAPDWGTGEGTKLDPTTTKDQHAGIDAYNLYFRLLEIQEDGWHAAHSRCVFDQRTYEEAGAAGLDQSIITLDTYDKKNALNTVPAANYVAQFFVDAFELATEIPRPENVLLVEDVTIDVETHLNGPLEPTIPLINIINEAGEALINSHAWKFLQGSAVLLDIIADQEYIELPDDFSETVALHSTNSLINSIQLTNLDELLRFRTYPVQATTFYTYAAMSFRRLNDGGSPKPVLELWPIPVATEYGRHTLFYRAGWQRVQKDSDIISIPIWLWTLYKQFARAFAAGYSEEHEASLSLRLQEIRASQMFQDAVRRDNVHQDTYGQVTGGNVEGMYLVRDWGINNRVLGPN